MSCEDANCGNCECKSNRVSFQNELETLINSHSMENGSNTPDFILAKYLMGCLAVYETAVNAKTKWCSPMVPSVEAQLYDPKGNI